MTWNDINEKLGKALDDLGRGLAELNDANNDWTHEEEIIWYAFYLLENASVDLGITK